MAKEKQTKPRFQNPRTYQGEREVAAMKRKLGIDAFDPPSDEIEVIEIDTPQGPRRIWADQVAEYDQVVAEMKEAGGK
jgi:hypothetical protein